MKPLNRKVISEMGSIKIADKPNRGGGPHHAGVYKVDPKQLRKDMVRILHEKQVIRDKGGTYTNDYSGPARGFYMRNVIRKRPENLELLCQIHHGMRHPHVVNSWKNRR